MSSEANGSRATTAYIVDNGQSRVARLHPLSITSVQLQDTFWQPRRTTNRTVTLPSQYVQSVETGRLNNFRRVAGTYDGPFSGLYYNDSDVYKWLEAAAWTLATDNDRGLEASVDEVIGLIVAAQGDDGYINTYYALERASERWSNLRDMHELYCAGHLIQAAIAHYRATGKITLLDVATKCADNILATFGPDARAGACGHPEIEMALVELARETGDARYLQEALFFIGQHGQQPPVISGNIYAQDHAPLREQKEVVGHAVRALYLYAGMSDVFAETGEQALDEAQETLWHNLIERKTYVTGGVGSRWEGEAFGVDYELPNRRAYAETCAAIASVMWNWRLLLLKGEARFADAIENALYNGVVSGCSLDGTHYFYQNPLSDRGTHRRSPWFGTACCPPNIARLYASLPGYFYSTSSEGIWLHLYASNMARLTLADGQEVSLEQTTNYPWDGEIAINVTLAQPTTFSIFARIPAWAVGADVLVNDEPLHEPVTAGSYVEIKRVWQSGDTIRISLPMTVRLLASHPAVVNNRDRVALAYGPLIYCLEQADHGEIDVWDIVLPHRTTWQVQNNPDLLGGVATLHTDAYARVNTDWEGHLYQEYATAQPAYRPVALTAIPYYAWANREAGPMQVWLPIERRV